MLTGQLSTPLYFCQLFIGVSSGNNGWFDTKYNILSIGLCLFISAHGSLYYGQQCPFYFDFCPSQNKNFWLAIITSSILKFAFLYTISLYFAPKLAFIMGLPQLITAIIGGIIAFLFLKL